MNTEIKKGTLVAERTKHGMWVTEVYNLLGSLIKSYSLDNILSALKDVSGIRMWQIDLKKGTVTAMEDDKKPFSTPRDSSTREKPYEWWKEEQLELDLY